MLNFLLSGEIRVSRAYTLFISIAPVVFMAALWAYVAWQKKQTANKKAGNR